MRAFWLMVVGMVFLSGVAVALDIAEKGAAHRVKQEIKTIYDINGRVVNQAEDAKGFHRVFGSTKLVAGVDTINLNTAIVNGLQDVSFISAGTYWGRAWSVNVANDSTYRVIPITGAQFIIKSSGGTDTATVNFVVEGE